MDGPEGKLICHIEFQSYNAKDMPYRMLRYALEVHKRKKLPINQLVVYFGQKKLTMKERIKYFIGPGQHLLHLALF
ncbi:Rpn family recombination-promoting nuclease/putative transposase [Heliorestis convoluta]|uniref:Transposase, YhgA-like family protein n=1 Tax=Heliorestis convoluta TaxID=356322 RepID=A0A5Q2N4P6_9FIRM|nr:Rpn family recombination-promoting nuclease/putative transposase [Heliorestis convoluta]QGG48859.1 transposase, YhgA-like family protein [Heliorestis convoluta]